VYWSETLPQEHEAAQAQQEGRTKDAREHYRRSEEIYRGLLGFAKQQGLYHLLGKFLYKELTMRRYQMPLWSSRRLLSKLFD